MREVKGPLREPRGLLQRKSWPSARPGSIFVFVSPEFASPRGVTGVSDSPLLHFHGWAMVHRLHRRTWATFASEYLTARVLGLAGTSRASYSPFNALNQLVIKGISAYHTWLAVQRQEVWCSARGSIRRRSFITV